MDSRAPNLVASLVVAVSLTVSGCSDQTAPSETAGLGTAPGTTVETVHEGLVGPTQFVVLDDDTFMVATINGGENDQLGQVVRVDSSTGDVDIIRDTLDKPTGLVVVDDELWVMERNRLSRGPLDGDGEPVVVVDDLPNNGRSEGTLTVTPDGHILFDTSGSKQGSTVVDGSGRLFTVDPDETPGTPTELASGFKHAYAHTFDQAGKLWATEMSDGSFDGAAAEDELVAVVAGADHGWPRCVGDNRPVAEFGGTAERCATTPPSAALFAPGATPTSVVVSPFTAPGDVDVLLVALWNEGRIVSVDPYGDQAGGDTATSPVGFGDVVTGLAGPQHLVATDDAVYVTEFGTGRILRLTSG